MPESLTSKQNPSLRELVKQRDAIEAKMTAAVRRQYPKGMYVSWEHGSYVRGGLVEDYGYRTDVFVRTVSGARIRRSATSFLEAGHHD